MRSIVGVAFAMLVLAACQTGGTGEQIRPMRAVHVDREEITRVVPFAAGVADKPVSPAGDSYEERQERMERVQQAGLAADRVREVQPSRKIKFVSHGKVGDQGLQSTEEF